MTVRRNAPIGSDRDLILRMLDAQDELRTDLGEISGTLKGQAAVLAEHVRRSTALETRIEQVADEAAPMKRHLALWSAAGKLLALGSAVVGLLGGLYKLMG